MKSSARPGIVDTLSAGFTIVNKRLWLIIIPVLLDLTLWIGPQISASPLVDRTISWYAQAASESPLILAPQNGSDEKASAEAISNQAKEVLRPLAEVNLLSGLAWGLPWGLPSLINTVASEPTSFGLSRPVLAIGSGLVLFTSVVGLVLGAVLITAVYKEAIAHLVRDTSADRERYLSHLGRNWLRMVGFFLLAIGALMFIGLPFALVVGLSGFLSSTLASLLSGLGGAAILWLMLYLFFVSDAIFVGDASVLGAIGQSFTLVRRNFWSSLGLFIIMNVILQGTPLAWGLITTNPAGVAIAILGNAYIATGLAAASMVFYRERFLPLKRGEQTQTTQSSPL